jgi:hypothetical protein
MAPFEVGEQVTLDGSAWLVSRVELHPRLQGGWPAAPFVILADVDDASHQKHVLERDWPWLRHAGTWEPGGYSK